MTPLKLDALINETPDAVMILLVEGAWRPLIGDPASAANRRDQGARPSFSGLLGWVVKLTDVARAFCGQQARAR